MRDWFKKYLAFLFTALLVFAVYSRAQNPSNDQGQPSNVVQTAGLSVLNDPCGIWGSTKQSVAVNISTATTTSIVAISGSTKIYVCGFNFSLTGTSPTWQLEYGTGGTCGTGTTALTGVYAADITAAIGQYMYGGGEMTITSTTASQGLCIVTGGTTPSLQGVVTFVQR